MRLLEYLLARDIVRMNLDIQLRCLGAPVSRWWESTRRMRERLIRAMEER